MTVPVGLEPPERVAVMVVLVPQLKEPGEADTDREGDATDVVIATLPDAGV